MQDYATTDGVLIASAQCINSTKPGMPGTGAALCNEFRFGMYPHLVYGDALNPQVYDGDHDYDSLSAFARQHLGPPHEVSV